MTQRVWIPLPDRDFDVTEVAVPWKLLRAAGYEVVFATEQGDVAQGDPRLLTGVLFGQLGADPEPKAFYQELVRDPAFLTPVRWAHIQPAAFDGLVLPGGHAPGMRQYLASELLQAKVAAFWSLKRPVGAICHGVLVLARAGVLANATTTCLPKYMEQIAYLLTFWKLGRYYRTYPAYVEEEVKAALDDPQRQFKRGPIHLIRRGSATNDGPTFVVEDGHYVSARWPGDAYRFAKTLIERLDKG